MTSIPKLVPGSIWPLRARFRQSGVAYPGGVVGWSVRLMIKDDPTKADAQALYDATFVGAGDTAAASEIPMSVPAAETADFPQDGYVWVQAEYWTPGNAANPRTFLLTRIKVPTAVIHNG